MKGIIKRVTSTLFAALFVLMGCSALVFGCALSLKKGDVEAHVVASAASEDYKSLPRYNGNFEFGTTASVDFTGYPSKDEKIKFNFIITNPDKFKLGTGESSLFDFVVVRTANGVDVPIYTLRILTSDGEIKIGHKHVDISGETMGDLSINPGAIELVPDQLTGESVKETKKSDVSSSYWNARQDKLNADGSKFTLDKIITIINQKPFLTHTNGDAAGKYKGYLMLDLLLTVNSEYSEYFLAGSSYYEQWEEYQAEEWKNPFKKETVTKTRLAREYSHIKSPTWSVSSALQAMKEEGRLTAANVGATSSTFAEISGFAGKPELKTITVEYLAQIGNSPFACKKKAKVAVPVVDGKVAYDDICSAMGNTSLKCLGATIAEFEVDTFDVYRAKYESSFYMQVKKEDGRYDEAYLKLEKSLAEFVDGLSARDVFENGTFSYALNDIRTLYPECENYEADEIYGLWGYIVIPETTSLNSVLADLLKVPPEENAIIKSFIENGSIKSSPYRNLLKSEYDYGWFSALTSWFFTWLTNELTAPVQHVFFYADLKETEGGIDKSAGTDGSVIGMLGAGLSEAFDGLSETLGQLFQREDSKDKTIRSILTLSGVVTVAGAAVAIAFLWYKKK